MSPSHGADRTIRFVRVVRSFLSSLAVRSCDHIAGGPNRAVRRYIRHAIRGGPGGRDAIVGSRCGRRRSGDAQPRSMQRILAFHDDLQAGGYLTELKHNVGKRRAHQLHAGRRRLWNRRRSNGNHDRPGRIAAIAVLVHRDQAVPVTCSRANIEIRKRALRCREEDLRSRGRCPRRYPSAERGTERSSQEGPLARS